MRYVVVGGSAAAISAIEAIRSIDRLSPIDLFSDEETPLFSRVLLPYYVAEELPKALLNFRSPDFFDQNQVSSHLGVRVEEISTDSKTIQTSEGRQYPFDKLLIATGGNPIIPPIPGIDKEGISPLKTMQDAERIYHLLGSKAVVIGAGSIGVEASISLKRRGLKVSLLEQLGHVLPTVFDEEAALDHPEEDRGDRDRGGHGRESRPVYGEWSRQKVLTDTREIECDMVVLAVGVRPAAELARKTGVKLAPCGGIKLDRQMMTSVPDIYAAGDVAETDDIARGGPFINAIWPCAFEQGHIAGLNMGGRKTVYPGSFRRNSIGNFIGIPAISDGRHPCGCLHDCADGDDFGR